MVAACTHDILEQVILVVHEYYNLDKESIKVIHQKNPNFYVLSSLANYEFAFYEYVDRPKIIVIEVPVYC